MIARLIFASFLVAALLSPNETRSETNEIQPIVELQSGDYLLGARSNGKWIDGEKAAPLVNPETTYRLFSFTAEVGKATGSKPVSADEPCPDTFTVKMSEKPQGALIAIAASWNPIPRAPRVASTDQPVYVTAVRDYLKGHGLREPEVKITKIVGVDLDGDGEDEVLINATNYGDDEEGISANAPGGSYSMVLVRRVVSGKVETKMIAGEIYPAKKSFSAPNIHRILSIIDLDGDGKMEVVLESAYYEGGGTTVYGFKSGKWVELLSATCGA
jgi:hypothetical protein